MAKVFGINPLSTHNLHATSAAVLSLGLNNANLESQSQESQSIITALTNQLQKDQKRANPEGTIIGIGTLLEDYGQQGSPTRTREALRREAGQLVLQKLQYEVMSHRAEFIKPATSKSCEWIWNKRPRNGQPSLADWLVSGTGVYFIAGNEGSGKSTLMKYLYQGHTFDLLSKWAAVDSIPLETAAFFFWRSGTQLEKSEEGLLRSILYSILSDQQQIIPSVLPGIWAKAHAFITSRHPSDSENAIGRWEIDDLREAFTLLLRQTQSSIKLFFLIDGIDEYRDDQVERRAMIELLTKEIATSKNAKAVITSRPLDDMNEFGISPSLTLHDSNHEAIHDFVKDTIDTKLQNYADQLPSGISDQIASSANGSFLWASLTVDKLSQVLAEGHSFDDADKILKKSLLPSDIHKLYNDMWAVIPTGEICRASQIMQIVLVSTSEYPQSADEEIRLVDLMFALGHPNETVNSPIMEWQARTIEQKCKETAYSFMSIWPGFITIARDNDSDPTMDPNARIQYCHRSVPEYFLSNGAQQSLRTALGNQPFCPHLAHLKGAVQHLRSLPSEVAQDFQSAILLWKFVTRALVSSKQVGSTSSAGTEHKMICQQLLQKLDETMSHHRDQQRKKGRGNREITLQDPYGFFEIGDFGHEQKYLYSLSWANFHPEHSHPRSEEDSFLSLCIQFGLKDYLEDSRYLNKKTLRSKKGRPLLDYATYPSPIAPYDLITPEIVETLLNYGANPNKELEIMSGKRKMKKVTCWEHALMWQHQTYKMDAAKQISGTTAQAKQIAETRLQIIKLLIEKGANPQAKILTSAKKQLGAKVALQESFGGWVDEGNLQRVLELLDVRSTRWGIRGLLKG